MLCKKKLGGGNDLTAHLQEQKDLQQIGKVAVDANQIGVNNYPLATIGQNPLSGLTLDPLNPNNPFSIPFNPNFGQAFPSYFN